MSRTIRASNAAVWAVLGDFGTEHRWTTSVRECHRNTESVGVGTVRTCTLPKPLMGRIQATEQLTEFEPGVALTYVLDGSAGPFVSASSRWSTELVSPELTNVAVEGVFTARRSLLWAILWPFTKLVLSRLTNRILRELDCYVASLPPNPARGQ